MSLTPHLYRQQAPSDLTPGVVESVLKLELDQKSLGVHSIYTLRHLSHLTEVGHGYLREIVQRTADGYSVYDIKKRDGTSRSIAAPDDQLQTVQRWLLDNVYSKMANHSSSYAYQKGVSVTSCAAAHIGATWLIHLDLKDFFHQTDERDVYHLLRRHRYSALVAFELARISTRMPSKPQEWLPSKYEELPARRTLDGVPYALHRLGYLPQGAPSSGAISNTLAHSMDVELAELALSRGLAYSRYSDDLTFSGHADFNRQSAEKSLQLLQRTVVESGYEVNAKKSRIVAPGRSIEILGVLVDGDRLRVTKRIRKRIEHHLRGIELHGIAAHQAHEGFHDPIGMMNHIRGVIDYVHDVEPERSIDYYNRFNAIDPRFGL